MGRQRPSNSSDASAGALGRARYLWRLAVMNARRRPMDAAAVHADVTRIAHRFEELTGRRADGACVLEIGFGARPHRAFALQVPFGEVVAVDLDQPMFGLAEFPAALRQNGPTRAIKGLVRSTVFDRGEWPAFHRGMKVIDPAYAPERTRLVVADAGSDAFWKTAPGPFDLVVSFDVFEHIPPEALSRLLARARANLAPDGIMMTYPNVFTGITGGHDPRWYTHKVEENDSGGAWRHLWDETFSVDTYLNRMTRREMRAALEAAGFEGTADRAVLGQLGERHLTPTIEARLRPAYDDYELFSNRVEFVLVPAGGDAGASQR